MIPKSKEEIIYHLTSAGILDPPPKDLKNKKNATFKPHTRRKSEL